MSKDTLRTFDDFWKLNPNGDKSDAMSVFGFYVDPISNSLFEYDIRSVNDLYDCYKEYVRFWKVKFGERDPKYISKKDDLRNIIDYIREDLFKQKFVLPTNSRDYYFFGNLTTKELQTIYDHFLKNTKL